MVFEEYHHHHSQHRYNLDLGNNLVGDNHNMLNVEVVDNLRMKVVVVVADAEVAVAEFAAAEDVAAESAAVAEVVVVEVDIHIRVVEVHYYLARYYYNYS